MISQGTLEKKAEKWRQRSVAERREGREKGRLENYPWALFCSFVSACLSSILVVLSGEGFFGSVAFLIPNVLVVLYLHVQYSFG